MQYKHKRKDETRSHKDICREKSVSMTHSECTL